MDVINVLADQWFAILIFLGIVLWGGTITAIWMDNSTRGHFSAVEHFSLAICGSLVPVLAWAFTVHLSRMISGSMAGMITALCILIPFILLKRKVLQAIKILQDLLLPVTIFLTCMIVNMALISRFTFPAYFDSAEHYRIIKFVLEAGAFEWPTLHYYHPGYHLILAAVVWLSGTGIVDAMLVGGQVILSMLPLSLFFIVKRETGSNPAAFFTTMLAGFGWYMPSHAINWGKYPALFGLLCSIFVFNLIYLMLSKNGAALQKDRLIPLLLGGFLAAGLIHTRSLIVCGFFATALLAANQWSTFEKNSRRTIFGVFLLILVGSTVLLRKDATFGALFSSYLKEDLPTLFPALLLSIYSIWKFPKLTLGLLLFTGLLFGSVYIPVPGVFGYQNLFLLDRPYVQILIHLPLSMISGLGFAGMVQAAASRQFAGRIPAGFIIQAGAFALLAINAIFYQEYRPSDCCQLAGRDDAAAFSWIQHELPKDASLLIASRDLAFSPHPNQLATTGVDAGIWISPMTARKTLFLPFDTHFTRTKKFHRELCQRGVDYIYVGNRPESFKERDLIKRPQWYQVVFVLPDVKIYRLTQCP